MRQLLRHPYGTLGASGGTVGRTGVDLIMCLEITLSISAPTTGNSDAAALSSLSGLHIRETRNDLGTCLHISSNGGCSCDLLDEAADFGDAYWPLDAAAAGRLADAVASAGALSQGIVFQAR
jgi:hypothetical protein